MDDARKQLDVEIRRTDSTRSMLEHLATVVETAPRAPRASGSGAGYSVDALAALLHGAEIAEDRKANLEHVARMYDAKAVDAPGD